MNTFDEFNTWLNENTTYTKLTKSNILSRLRRANKMLPIVDEPIYLFQLSQLEEFQSLSTSVKSQIRRSIKLYLAYIKEKVTHI